MAEGQARGGLGALLRGGELVGETFQSDDRMVWVGVPGVRRMFGFEWLGRLLLIRSSDRSRWRSS